MPTVPKGSCFTPVSGSRVGAGEFGPVRREVWEFSVSRFQVLHS